MSAFFLARSSTAESAAWRWIPSRADQDSLHRQVHVSVPARRLGFADLAVRGSAPGPSRLPSATAMTKSPVGTEGLEVRRDSLDVPGVVVVRLVTQLRDRGAFFGGVRREDGRHDIEAERADEHRTVALFEQDAVDNGTALGDEELLVGPTLCLGHRLFGGISLVIVDCRLDLCFSITGSRRPGTAGAGADPGGHGEGFTRRHPPRPPDRGSPAASAFSVRRLLAEPFGSAPHHLSEVRKRGADEITLAHPFASCKVSTVFCINRL